MSQTLQFNGDLVDFDRLEDIKFDIDNVINSAVKVCRFNGHTKFHYSNLQHMYNVSILCPEHIKLAGLLHDAHEVIIGDIVTPLANYFGGRWKEALSSLKDYLDELIAEQFKCPELITHKDEIKIYDIEMTNIEAAQLIQNSYILFDEPTMPFDIIKEENMQVRHNYRTRFNHLMKGR